MSDLSFLLHTFLSCAALTLILFLNSQDIVSEHPERFFVAEIVREKIFMQYRNEIPYACQVIIEFIILFMIQLPSLHPTKGKKKKNKEEERGFEQEKKELKL